MNWNPIETAPKDGTAILATGPYEQTGVIAFVRGKWLYQADEISAIERQGDTYTDYAEFTVPLFWAPLPAYEPDK